MITFMIANPMFWLAKKMSDLVNLSKKSDQNSDIESPTKSGEGNTSNKDSVPISVEDGSKETHQHATTQDTIENKAERIDGSIEEYEKWCKQLVELIGKIDLESQAIHSERGEYLNLKAAREKTIDLSKKVFDNLGQLAARFNDASLKADSGTRVRLSSSKHSINTVDSPSSKTKKLKALTEFRITSATRSLSIVTEPGKLYAYLLPANINLDTGSHETIDRLKLGIVLDSADGENSWNVNGLSVSNTEISYLCKVLLRDLVILSCLDNLAYESGKKFEHVENIERVSIGKGHKDSLSLTTEISADLFRDLLIAQQNTVQKLLKQQEEIQASIARDLHDTVLADIMMLERRTTSITNIDKDSLLETLQEISVTIREICQGLVPRDLKDWGLETVLEDLVDKTAERIQADCSFSVEGTLPDLPSAVELHIFRIVQEALNNIEKYSEAKNVKVDLAFHEGLFQISVEDNGIGFELKNSRDSDGKSGFGLPSINERLEIIRAYYPAKLKFDSKTNQGTTIKLEITVESFE